MAKAPSNPFCMPYPDKSGSNQYQMRHLNPPDEPAKQNQKTIAGIKQIRVNLCQSVVNNTLNFLIRQIQFVVIFLREIREIL